MGAMAPEVVVDIRKHFRAGFQLDVTFTFGLQPPMVLVLFGPSGAGKSTVLRGLAGLEWPDEGRIHFGSEVWFDHRTGERLLPQQRSIGYMFQDLALFPVYSVARNIA
jgi:molybdate transport system ATP-binding protein